MAKWNKNMFSCFLPSSFLSPSSSRTAFDPSFSDLYKTSLTLTTALLPSVQLSHLTGVRASRSATLRECVISVFRGEGLKGT